MTRRNLWAIGAVVVIAAINYRIISVRSTVAGHGDPRRSGEQVVAAGPGRVEAASEELRVSAAIGGLLERVLVEEGDKVKAGQAVAVLEHADYAARVRSAEAALQLRDAEARRVRNGARAQERADAAAAVHEAEAVLDSAAADVGRRRELLREDVISRDEMDQAEQKLKVAQARLDSLRERQSLVEADAREEDQTRADADVALARAQLAEARAMLDKTSIRAPISGVVLRKLRKAGETVSTQFESPIVTIADRSSVRVRVDVDEGEVAHVRVGQHAYATADAFGDRRFTGRVIRVAQILGRKNIRTDEQTERVDAKILETLVELDDGHELPLGLRMQVFMTERD
jgi:multidrug resistance efflux pump